MVSKHYMRVQFGITYGTPEIYDFIYDYLPAVFKKLGVKQVSLEIERLESMNTIFTNMPGDTKKIKRAFSRFIKSHHLHKAASLTAEKGRTSIEAKVAVDRLKNLLNDYDMLFDLFFTDLSFKGGDLSVELMDPFNNSALLSGRLDSLQKLKAFVLKHARGPVEFRMADKRLEKPKAGKKAKQKVKAKKKTKKAPVKKRKIRRRRARKPAKPKKKAKAKKPAKARKKTKPSKQESKR